MTTAWMLTVAGVAFVAMCQIGMWPWPWVRLWQRSRRQQPTAPVRCR